MMEVRITAPIPKGQKAPAPPTPIDLGPDDRTSDCEALGVVGHILHQDMSNLVEIQKGLKAAKPDKAYMTLARYQESNIQHFHNVYSSLLGLGRKKAPKAVRTLSPSPKGLIGRGDRSPVPLLRSHKKSG